MLICWFQNIIFRTQGVLHVSIFVFWVHIYEGQVKRTMWSNQIIIVNIDVINITLFWCSAHTHIFQQMSSQKSRHGICMGLIRVIWSSTLTRISQLTPSFWYVDMAWERASWNVGHTYLCMLLYLIFLYQNSRFKFKDLLKFIKVIVSINFKVGIEGVSEMVWLK